MAAISLFQIGYCANQSFLRISQSPNSAMRNGDRSGTNPQIGQIDAVEALVEGKTDLNLQDKDG